ncbi:phosphate acyltransferase [Mycoplasmopsis cynos]|uniref:phosphate acyltransferase n=1 Tax=Mycoplasmopsis cynos TaxID=171284 RepID=UPI003A5C7B34
MVLSWFRLHNSRYFKALHLKWSPRKGIKTISSVMVVYKDDFKYIFSDISVNIKPTADQLVEIALNAVDFAINLNIEPRVAFLSFSTGGFTVSYESKIVSEASD